MSEENKNSNSYLLEKKNSSSIDSIMKKENENLNKNTIDENSLKKESFEIKPKSIEIVHENKFENNLNEIK
jgi:hypothetical protein